MSAAERHTLLKDGTPIRMRPVRAEDRDEFVAAFEGLSATSRYTRFMTPMVHLTDAEVAYFLDVDHQDHEAIVATDEASGDRIGIGRYVRDPERPERAEIAITVADEWQGRGVGTALLGRLAELAIDRGIMVFTAEMLGTNTSMRTIFDRLGPATHTSTGDGAMHAEVAL